MPAITKVGASTAPSGSTGSSHSANFTAGAVNDLIHVVAWYAGTTSGVTMTISDSQGNTWIPAIPLSAGSAANDRIQSWYCFAKNTSASTVTITYSAAVTFKIIWIDMFRDTDLTSAVLGPTTVNTGSGNPTSGAFTPAYDNALVVAISVDTTGAAGLIGGTTATLAADDAAGDKTEYRVLTGQGGQSMTAAFAGSGAYTCASVVFYAPVIVTTVEQEGFRWRNDDGSESTATWQAAQDTTTSIVPATRARLRVLVNGSGDPSAGNYQLEYRRVGDAAWRIIDTFQ